MTIRTAQKEGQLGGCMPAAASRREVTLEFGLRDRRRSELQPLGPRERRGAPDEQDEYEGNEAGAAQESSMLTRRGAGPLRVRARARGRTARPIRIRPPARSAVRSP